MHFPDHPAAILGLSNILLDIYTEDLLPAPSNPPLQFSADGVMPSTTTLNSATNLADPDRNLQHSASNLELGPLGFQSASQNTGPKPFIRHPSTSSLEPPYKASSTALLDRLAARDRAYGLLTALTRLGTGWNHSEAWFALARAYEVGGQVEKAKEVLWWCVELEEGKGVRDWTSVAVGGYAL